MKRKQEEETGHFHEFQNSRFLDQNTPESAEPMDLTAWDNSSPEPHHYIFNAPPLSLDNILRYAAMSSSNSISCQFWVNFRSILGQY